MFFRSDIFFFSKCIFFSMDRKLEQQAGFLSKVLLSTTEETIPGAILCGRFIRFVSKTIFSRRRKDAPKSSTGASKCVEWHGCVLSSIARRYLFLRHPCSFIFPLFQPRREALKEIPICRIIAFKRGLLSLLSTFMRETDPPFRFAPLASSRRRCERTSTSRISRN